MEVDRLVLANLHHDETVMGPCPPQSDSLKPGGYVPTSKGESGVRELVTMKLPRRVSLAVCSIL